jgi:hypothetical protein
MAERAQQRSTGWLLALASGIALGLLAVWALWPRRAPLPSPSPSSPPPPSQPSSSSSGAVDLGAGATRDAGPDGGDGGAAAPSVPPALGSAILSGVVVDEAGAPVAAARVDLVTDGPDGVPLVAVGEMAPDPRLEPSGELGILRGPIPFPPPAPLALPPELPAVRTDARGAFRVERLPAGRVIVAAAHPRAGRATSDPVELREGAVVEVRLTLRRGETLAGRVVDERDVPIAGVEILLDEKVVALTDARGQWRLDDVTRDVTLAPRKAGWAGAPRAVSLTERRDLWSIDFRLRPVEARLDGVVVDERGVGLAGARVALMGARGARTAALTDRAGAFRLDGLGGSDAHRLEISHPDFAPRVVDAVAGREELRLALDPGAGVDGTVRDGTSGRVPAGVAVVVRAGGRERALTVDRAGRFSGWGLPVGAAVVEASAPGYATVARPITLVAGTRPREITTRDLDLVMERGARLRARVIDTHGDPVAAAAVVVAGRRGRTDARGEVTIDGLPPGRGRATAEANGLRATSDELDLRSDETARVELRLE